MYIAQSKPGLEKGTVYEQDTQRNKAKRTRQTIYNKTRREPEPRGRTMYKTRSELGLQESNNNSNNNNEGNFYSALLPQKHRLLFNMNSNTKTLTHAHTRLHTHTHTNHGPQRQKKKKPVEKTDRPGTVLKKMGFKSGFGFGKKNQSDGLTKADCSRQIGQYKRMIFRRIILCLHEG